MKQPLAKKVVAAVAVKQIVDRIQEARAPRKSFLRRHWGKLAVVALAGGGYVAWRSQQAAADSFGAGAVQPSRREPSIEPDERLDTQIRVPEATETSTTPSPAGR
jgi:hypothetical protein